MIIAVVEFLSEWRGVAAARGKPSGQRQGGCSIMNVFSTTNKYIGGGGGAIRWHNIVQCYKQPAQMLAFSTPQPATLSNMYNQVSNQQSLGHFVV